MNRLKELRGVANMTQDDLAKKLHCKRSVISKYESGAVPLTDALIVELTNIFNVSADYLLCRTEKKEPTTFSDDRSNKIDSIYDKLTTDNQSKLLELARLYLADQNNSEGKR